MNEIERKAENDMLTIVANAQRQRLVSTGSDDALFDPLTGLTHSEGVVKGSRQVLRGVIQKAVEQEANSGRWSWPSRAARRAWVRDETKRRYTAAVNPKPLG